MFLMKDLITETCAWEFLTFVLLLDTPYVEYVDFISKHEASWIHISSYLKDAGFHPKVQPIEDSSSRLMIPVSLGTFADEAGKNRKDRQTDAGNNYLDSDINWITGIRTFSQKYQTVEESCERVWFDSVSFFKINNERQTCSQTHSSTHKRTLTHLDTYTHIGTHRHAQTDTHIARRHIQHWHIQRHTPMQTCTDTHRDTETPVPVPVHHVES